MVWPGSQGVQTRTNSERSLSYARLRETVRECACPLPSRRNCHSTTHNPTFRMVGSEGRRPMKRGLFAANEALAFLLELAALAALAAWGFAVGDGGLAKAALAIGAPLLAAVVWGLFAAPRA